MTSDGPESTTNDGTAIFPDDASAELLAELDERLSAVLNESDADPLASVEPASVHDVGAEIGHGGMGSVLVARERNLRRTVAMKVIRDPEREGGGSAERHEPSARTRRRRVRRFLREARITGQLDHPGVIPVHELGRRADGEVFFTMPLVRGRDLAIVFDLARRAAEGWSLARAVGVLQRVCETVAYAHSRGVIHRDLKPRNVMVGSFGETYVLDWGLAKLVGEAADVETVEPEPETAVDSAELAPEQVEIASERLDPGETALFGTRPGTALGSAGYMAPEQAAGDPTPVGRPADVYAVGAMLYTLLAGHPPYQPNGQRRTHAEVIRQLRSGHPEPIRERAPDAPPELHSVCERAMRRNPEARYPTMQALADDLRAFLEGRVVTAHSTGPVAELRKWVGRNRALAATILVSLVLALTGTSTASIILAGKNRSIQDEKQAVEREQARFLRLSDARRLEGLRARAEALWPALPERIDDYRAWLDDADELLARLPLHRATLEEMTVPEVPEATEDPASPREVSTEELWLRERLSELVDGLEDLGRPQFGELAKIGERLAFAETIGERTVDGAEARDLWNRAIASIADPDECPAYGGLELRPQIGILPLSRDPRSGLWEFWHVQTGDRPRQAEDGHWAVDGDSGLVLVLLPSGSFRMGAQSEDPNGPGFDPLAEPIEGPVRTVAVAPFFLSKYAMTQGQWRRFTNSSPSYYSFTTYPDVFTRAHPVENVSWTECDRTLRRLHLMLPSEAQWEYGARGGTTTRWWTGVELESLVEHRAANLREERVRAGALPGSVAAQWNDGRRQHGPAGYLAANPYGLHDVHGNVWEWCNDVLRPTFELAEDAERRVARGGSYASPIGESRVTARTLPEPGYTAGMLGVRPAREIDP